MLTFILVQGQLVVVEQVAGDGHPVAGHGGRADGTGEANLGDARASILGYVLVIVQIMHLPNKEPIWFIPLRRLDFI